MEWREEPQMMYASNWGGSRAAITRAATSARVRSSALKITALPVSERRRDSVGAAEGIRATAGAGSNSYGEPALPTARRHQGYTLKVLPVGVLDSRGRACGFDHGLPTRRTGALVSASRSSRSAAALGPPPDQAQRQPTAGAGAPGRTANGICHRSRLRSGVAKSMPTRARETRAGDTRCVVFDTSLFHPRDASSEAGHHPSAAAVRHPPRTCAKRGDPRRGVCRWHSTSLGSVALLFALTSF